MRKMTDNEIIKALECCLRVVKNSDVELCHNCPLNKTRCSTALPENAFDLINRLKDENEKKSKAVVKAAQEVVDLKIKAKQQRAEIERLKGSKSTGLKEIESTVNEFWDGLQKMSMFKGKEKPTLEELLEYIEQKEEEIRRLKKDKADIISAVEYRINQAKEFAYKEFAEQLQDMLGDPFLREHNDVCVVIDKILAELTPSNFTKVDHSSLCETETYEGK